MAYTYSDTAVSQSCPQLQACGTYHLRAPGRIIGPGQEPETGHAQSTISYKVPVSNPRYYSSAALPTYNSLADPCLRDYFLKRFMKATPKKERIQYTPGRRGSARPNTSDKGCLYRVSVTTGDLNHSGTDAKAYIQLFGSKGRLEKRELSRNDQGFRRGSTHFFNFEERNIGRLTSLEIQHDGESREKAWYVDHVRVVMQNMSSGHQTTWVFYCQDWLSLHHSDGQSTRRLVPFIINKTTYEVLVFTGNPKGAGTNANVFLTIFGNNGMTAKLPLENNNSNCFQRKQCDTFNLKTTCVGPLTKIRIQHDNRGQNPDWFLNYVVVKDLKHPEWLYYFDCDKWLSKGQISMELDAILDSAAVKQRNKYLVRVHTGRQQKARSQAPVYLTLLGEDGNSGEIKLTSSKPSFTRGAVDEFEVEEPCVGCLEEIRIGLQNPDSTCSWFVEKVAIKDLANACEYEFSCDAHLTSKQKYVDTPCDMKPQGHSVKYTVDVLTGDRGTTPTSAQVYVVLHGGPEGDAAASGKLWLTGGGFRAGGTDSFPVETPTVLSPLSGVDIGHDNSGSNPAMYVEQVVVRCVSTGVEQVFSCNQWLASDREGGLIQRTLQEATRSHCNQVHQWLIKVYTSDRRNADTPANVRLQMFGRNDACEAVSSETIPLNGKQGGFQRGKVDDFTADTSDMGQLYKIRVGHDNTGQHPAWHLDRMEITNTATDAVYLFRCSRWLAADEDDHSVIREIPAEGKHIAQPEPLVKYEVSVYTGSQRDAGTDASVFLNIFGEQGDTGARPLTSSSTHERQFQSRNVDVFMIESVNLEVLEKIEIGHRCKGTGAGWFLDKVIICQLGADKDVLFPCGRWLDTAKEDHEILREIPAETTDSDNKLWLMWVCTSGVRHASATTNVWMEAYGWNGDGESVKSDCITLDKNPNRFQQGKTDKLKIEMEDVGDLYKLRIGLQTTGISQPRWKLDHIKLKNLATGIHYMFRCGRWLDAEQDDHSIVREMSVEGVDNAEPLLQYEVTMHTNSPIKLRKGSNVFLNIVGDQGDTGDRPLTHPTHQSHPSSIYVDTFLVEAVRLRALKHLVVSHDGARNCSGRYIHRVTVQQVGTGHTQVVFPCYRWLRVEDDKEKAQQEMFPSLTYEVTLWTGDTALTPSCSQVTVGLKGEEDSAEPLTLTHSNNFKEGDNDSFVKQAKDVGPISLIRVGLETTQKCSWFLDKVLVQRHLIEGSERRPQLSEESETHESVLEKVKGDDCEEVEDTWFVCRRWFSQREDDGLIIRTIPPTDEDGNALNDGLKEVTYRVIVVTGSLEDAATDSNVFIKLKGSLRESDELALLQSQHVSLFAETQSDEFTLRTLELGEIQSVSVRNDSSGINPSWFLDHVEVEDTAENQQYTFPCKQWLAEDDGNAIIRELVPGPLEEDIQYKITVYTSDLHNAGSSGKVHIKMYGPEKHTIKHFLCSKEEQNEKRFKRGQRSSFKVELADVDEIQKLCVGVVGSGERTRWHLDKVVVRSGKGGRSLTFPCRKWLGGAGSKTERYLYPRDD